MRTGKARNPFFGRPASGRRFMVAAYDPASLVALLEAQVRLDSEATFPSSATRMPRSR